MFDYHRSKSFQASYDTKLQMKDKDKVYNGPCDILCNEN